MIERIIEASVRNRFLVLLIAAGLAVAGVFAVYNTPIDAIPDLSENQVIVFADWMGRSPKEIEDQVTYPLSLKLQGLAGVKVLRSSSEFNFSMITIIFEDSVDFYFARQRVLERLSLATTFLPQGVVPYMAPDATALGQIYWYTVEGGNVDPGRLWALQKFYIGPQLNGVQGVAEVASVGGAPLEYQIDVQPDTLRAYGVTLGDVYAAISRSNLSVGGRVIQKNNAEYLIRSVGWIRDKADIEDTVVKENSGTPVYVKNLATVQLGMQFRRSVFEKDGNEVVGGVVMMRYGENPLAVTSRIKEKIQQIQPGLPEGVRLVPAYERTRLILGAIHTLTEVMWHEMLIASLAVVLILRHVRSAIVICLTLPLSLLFAFLLMWVLRQLRIIDIQANIMSLAGLTISIGILVDQAIVMTENATHHLKEKFGDQPVRGDTRELVIAACKTVGRPIFFSVLIMLLSFLPVFALSGREGKLFHPLAFTKSFAMIGVALLSVTVVPAMIPSFVRGRLYSEEENWIVRSFINLYKPMLEWALSRRNLVMWAFAVLLILGAGMFPLQALFGYGASQPAWAVAFFIVFAVTTVFTVALIRGFAWQALSFASLLLLGCWAYDFPKIGVSFMPALDEGSVLDMPVTVPRVSVTQVADDLKARDALLRGFPEVESVIGKSGRAETATDPAPLDMVETFVNFRPIQLWPRRVLRFDDAAWQTERVIAALEQGGWIRPAKGDDRKQLVNQAAQKALERFDESMRSLALLRYQEHQRELGPELVRYVVQKTIHRIQRTGLLHWTSDVDEPGTTEVLTREFASVGPHLAANPALEDMDRIARATAKHLKEAGVVDDAVVALAWEGSFSARSLDQAAQWVGASSRSFGGDRLQSVEKERLKRWRTRVRIVNAELFDRGVEAFTWFVLEESVKAARVANLLADAPQAAATRAFAEAASSHGKNPMSSATGEPFVGLADQLRPAFSNRIVLWPRGSGPKGDLVDDEMGRVLQVPGWSNIFTQPIINRIEMLSTGVRTDIGVKVFGPDQTTIDRVCREIETAIKPISGSRDVVAAPIMGKPYLEIVIDRKRAGRYGVNVADIQDTVEVALGGRLVTQTVEDRQRFPVRIRYARAEREDEEAVRRLLISTGGSVQPSADRSAEGGVASGMPSAASAANTTASSGGAHAALPEHARRALGPAQIPLASVADVRIVEGPAMIKSENSQLLNYVTLNVRGRDMVGFVDEAQRVVAEKVTLPDGVHIEWSGEFEHQVRAAHTLRFVVPMVLLLIFVLLYMTYHDLADAGLMMLAVPEALAGGALFQYFWPKILHGWAAPPMDFSVAVWVGYIACFGMATETGVIMLVYLREAIEKRGGLEGIASLEELRQAVVEGAVHRLRPKLLTEGVAIIAIAPMLWATGVGGEIIGPMAVPVLGGLLIADEVVDVFLPVRFFWVRRGRWLKLQRQKQAIADASL